MNQKRIVIPVPSWVGIVLAGLLLLAAVVAVGCAAPPQPLGQIELSATEFDFGTIANTGPVSRVFQILNVGQGPLEIGGVSTSCGCTTAEIGSRRLAPGEATDLAVTYDPLAHGGATGDFMRIVYVRSNDPDTPEASLTFRVTVAEP